QTCTACTASEQKIRPDQKGCIASCPANSNEQGGVCRCAETHEPSSDGQTCVPKTSCKTENCKVCENKGTDRETCTECNDGTYLTPTNQCTTSCAALSGYYGDAASKTCKQCDSSCASCSTAGADKCLSCPVGKVLKYTSESSPTDGTCVDECKTNTGGCADCGAVIGGSRYCSKCGDASQAPLNGNCAANTARTKFCTTVKDGACTQCANGYFLLDGGCYQTTRQPGKSVCTTDSNGKCTQCANGQNPNSSGVCPLCHETCAKCSAASSETACTECLAGYYLSGTKCVKCNTNDGSITGVENCISCAPPSNGNGAVICYVTQQSTDPSVNKGGLSSGAIAGISVAVIAVVGGLVGFLCWWFICRGKA
ncbi:Variant-specific surface protein, partial [Giardia duodenalis]